MSTFAIVFAAMRLALGSVVISVAIAGAEDVAFGSDAWRVVFGLVGAFVAVAVLTGLVRAWRGERPDPTPETVRRARLYGAGLFVIGLWLVVSAFSDGALRMGLGLDGWAAPVFGAGGLVLVTHGLVLQVDPTRLRRKARVVAGEGVRKTATVIRASDLGTLRGMAKVKVEMTIDVGGRPEHHSAKTLIDRGRLARIEGATVDVLVHPADPTIFDVKWDTLREPPAASS